MAKKKRKRAAKMTPPKRKEASRYIPKKVRVAVDSRDSFECAWCGTRLTERHHIEEYGVGGEHVPENLILLCSNCHTEVHKAESQIQESELILRKSTHLQGDRIAGNLPFDAEQNKVIVGGVCHKNHNPLIAFSRQPVLSLCKHGDGYVINCRIFNKKGELVFWMSKNRFWATSNFTVSIGGKRLEIRNAKAPENNIIIEQIGDSFKVNFRNYHRGRLVQLNDEGLLVVGNIETPLSGYFGIKGEGSIDWNGKGAINV